MQRITIIGGGASGTLLAMNLLRYGGEQRREINLVEKRGAVGRGVAFSTVVDTHLLNVPAGKMGAFPDDLEHFHRWLSEKGHNFDHAAFVPRQIFGEYLQDCLEAAEQAKKGNVLLNVFDDEAIDVIIENPETEQAKAQVVLRSGDVLYSEHIALAFGNFLPPHPNVADLDFTKSPKYYRDPWSADLSLIDAEEPVLIIGTGLSMVDITLELDRSGHHGPIYAISTRGLLPAVHKLGSAYPSFASEVAVHTRITDILKTVRRHIKKAEASGSDWRAVIDSLRPVTQQLWQGLPVAERKYFLQHLSRYWNVARHRMPPQAALVIDELRGTGQLQILKGRLKRIVWDETANRFDVAYSTVGIPQDVRVGTLINCIGSESNFSRLDSDLVSNLFERGLVRCDDMNFGLDATPDGRLISASGKPSSLMYTLGTALKGILWETTAIPEIRAQAAELAQKLISNRNSEE